MQYYRIGETLETLDSLPPEDEAVLAVLRPDELHTAPLPQGITPPQPPEDPRDNRGLRRGDSLRQRCGMQFVGVQYSQNGLILRRQAVQRLQRFPNAVILHG